MATRPLRPLLVTSFAAFGGRPENTSQVLLGRNRAAIKDIGRKAGFALHELELPVVWGMCGNLLKHGIESTRPDGIFMMGEHNGAAFRLEQYATSRRRDSRDETSKVFEPEHHTEGFQDYTCALDLAGMAKKIPEAEVSTDAGGFLCEDAYYNAANWQARLQPEKPPNVFFLHVPRPQILYDSRTTELSQSDETLREIFGMFVTRL